MGSDLRSMAGSREADQPGKPTNRLPHIQALRAIAVLIVIAYHFWPRRVPGGFIGVDVFFVISGYLITGNLVRSAAASGRVRLAEFYARRARRLLPAALLVIAVTLIGVVAWLPVTRWVANFVDAAASGTYVLNWVLIAKSADYEQASAAASAFQHYWSLSVEEQFYLVWPLLVILGLAIASRRARPDSRALLAILGVATIASFAFGAWQTAVDPAAAYFSTPARAWEFGAGALLSFARFGMPRLWSAILSWAAIAALAACSLLYGATTPFPGVAALVVVAAVLVLLHAVPIAGNWGPLVVMRWRPVQYVGDISYSLYLWHWPVIVLGAAAVGQTLHTLDKLVLLALVIVLSVLTKQFVEDPVRRAHWLVAFRPRRSLMLGALSFAIAIGIGIVGVSATHARVAQLAAAGGLVPAPVVASSDLERNLKCLSPTGSSVPVTCTYGPAGATRIALVGDSHAEALSGAIVQLALDQGIQVDTYFKLACGWGSATLSSSKSFIAECADYRTRLESQLVAGGYDAIITTSAVYRSRSDASVSNLADSWTPLAAAGVPIYVIADNPRWPLDPVDCLVAAKDPATCDIPRADGFPWPDPQVEAVTAVAGAHLVDLTSNYCGSTTCFASRDGFVLFRDRDHLTKTFARSLESAILTALSVEGFPGLPGGASVPTG